MAIAAVSTGHESPERRAHKPATTTPPPPPEATATALIVVDPVAGVSISGSRLSRHISPDAAGDLGLWIKVRGGLAELRPIEEFNELPFAESASSQKAFHTIFQNLSEAVTLIEPKFHQNEKPRLLGWIESGRLLDERVPPLPITLRAFTAGAANDQIPAALRAVLSAAGPSRTAAEKQAATLILRAGASIHLLNRVVELLISSRKSGRIDAAIDILTLLGRETVHSFAEDRLHSSPPNGSNLSDDYWYAVIRSAGRVEDREIIERLIDSPNPSIQEAAVEALADVGGSLSRDLLHRIANDPHRPSQLRDLAREIASEMS
jgi:hypothetical protein